MPLAKAVFSMSDAAREDCARPAAAAAHLAIAPAGLCIVCEGAARLAVAHDMAAQPGSSAGFYNPRMRLNRELCLSELKAALRARGVPRAAAAAAARAWVPRATLCGSLQGLTRSGVGRDRHGG